MVYKIFFISTLFFYLVYIWEPGKAMPSESIVAKSRRNTYEKHMYKAPNEKDSQEIFHDNNKKMLPVANTSLHDEDSPIIYLNINKFNIRQYKDLDSNRKKTEEEIIYDKITIRDNLNINGTLYKLKPNITRTDSKHDEEKQSYQETVENSSRRLSPNLSEKLLPSDTLATTRNSSSNESQQLSTLSISRDNEPTNCNSDITEKANETDFRRTFDTKNIINNEQGQDLQDLDVTELSNAVTNPRLCYVCNSIYDPSCWSPGRKTAVKYCREQHQVCLTHLHIHDGASYVVRECGSTCISTTFGKSSESFASCTVCYTDLCNNAHYLKSQNFIFLILILLKLLKY